MNKKLSWLDIVELVEDVFEIVGETVEKARRNGRSKVTSEARGARKSDHRSYRRHDVSALLT